MEFWSGLLLITSIHLLAAASPGPDFVMVSQQTLAHGKRTGLWTSLGIALGLGIHVAYSVLGLAAVVAHSQPALTAIKWLGGAYLVYLGIKGLRARPASGVASPVVAGREPQAGRAGPAAHVSVGKGFLCNALNPKAPVYFVSLFTIVLSPSMPLYQLAAYGLWMMVLQMIWFATVTLILSQPRLQRRFRQAGHWIDRVCGAAMLALGLKVLATRSQ